VSKSGAFARHLGRYERRSFQKISVDRYWNADRVESGVDLVPVSVVILVVTLRAPAICGRYYQVSDGDAVTARIAGQQQRSNVYEECCSNCSAATFIIRASEQAGTRLWGQPDAATGQRDH
jgi:hypothetical protein